MTGPPRRARVRAPAKINLGLKVLSRRPDGFHELRTVFQTISLGDILDFEFTAGRRTLIESTPAIPDNLIVRAAEALFDKMRRGGALKVHLTKKVPMGGGLGGGSSDAAAVLLALPVLAGCRLPLESLLEIAAGLGSDVPFFLLGGAAVALGRGTELYPLPDTPPRRLLLVTPDVQVSTPEAYRALRRGLTSAGNINYINRFQAFAWEVGGRQARRGRPPVFENDFESVVFDLYPRLKSIKRELLKMGATSAMLSGSGSALFGLFESRAGMEASRDRLGRNLAVPARTVSRSQFRSLWWRSLAPHMDGREWPPRSRYA
jgi:4-diphosphocytidyl-2-C-methyl-D-erythritol kinase